MMKLKIDFEITGSDAKGKPNADLKLHSISLKRLRQKGQNWRSYFSHCNDSEIKKLCFDLLSQLKIYI